MIRNSDMKKYLHEEFLKANTKVKKKYRINVGNDKKQTTRYWRVANRTHNMYMSDRSELLSWDRKIGSSYPTLMRQSYTFYIQINWTILLLSSRVNFLTRANRAQTQQTASGESKTTITG